MASKLMYSTIVSNSYLRVSKEVKASSQNELDFKANEQLRKWAEKEAREREKVRIQNLKDKATRLDEEAKQLIGQYEDILLDALKCDHKIYWQDLMDNRVYPEFEYDISSPTQAESMRILNVPTKSFLEVIIKSKERKRLDLEQKAQEHFHNRLKDYEQEKELRRLEYEEGKKSFKEAQQKCNDEINLWKQMYENKDGGAIERYLNLVLEKSIFPDGLEIDSEASYDSLTQTAAISIKLPPPSETLDIIGYKYVASRKEIDKIKMKKKAHQEFYDLIIRLIILKLIHEVFDSMYIEGALTSVVCNGWVADIDKATGKDYQACILSVQISKEDFDELTLEKVDPVECLRNMKALSAGPLYNVAPIKPILELNREDSRFISTIDVLDGMEENTNLATMPWEDFEHLVRELFGKVFSKGGGEVKVTQASRDGGVDAIAFDPDPIRGGKFVIQAKRYNNVVGVSACRDLYGTMINEGAAKGILVTTSYFGKDSREFVKDKPISLIDGANLVHMFNEYGYDFKINLKESV